ncbi:hypothetical protein SRHO_G00145070 [Serrasalmus rhombeus]
MASNRISQTEVATECHQRVVTEIQREWKSHRKHRSGRPLATAHTDDHLIVNSALRNRMMNATQLQAHLREEPIASSLRAHELRRYVASSQVLLTASSCYGPPRSPARIEGTPKLLGCNDSILTKPGGVLCVAREHWVLMGIILQGLEN